MSHNGPGFGYIFRYRRQGSIAWSEETILPGKKPQFTIYNTSANELWDVQVQSYNDEGTGPECPTAQAQSGNEGNVLIAECFLSIFRIYGLLTFGKHAWKTIFPGLPTWCVHLVKKLSIYHPKLLKS